MRAFFAEGGRRLYVLPLDHDGGDAPQAADYAQALAMARLPEEASVLAAPGASAWCVDVAAAYRVLIDAAEQPGARRFALLDAPPGATTTRIRELARGHASGRAALYYPWIAVARAAHVDAAAPAVLLPPSGHVCGIYARTDRERGVHKAPANERLHTAAGLERYSGTSEQEALGPEGVNCIRDFTGRGIRVWGARTLSRDPGWTYVATRRYLDHLQRSIENGFAWVVFEPGGEALWRRVRARIDRFLHEQWRAGALVGTRPEQAWFVRCDATTMDADDIARGRVVCLAGVATMRAGEFQVLRLVWQTASPSACGDRVAGAGPC